MDRTKATDLVSQSVLYQQLAPLRQAHCVPLGTNTTESVSRSVITSRTQAGIFSRNIVPEAKRAIPNEEDDQLICDLE